MKGGTIHCRLKIGGIIYQIAGNQVDLKVIHPGVNVGMLSIFLLVMGSGEPGNLQGRTQIALRWHP
jgi:hypothetical protein